jgi:carbonic anhydrase
MPCLLRPLAAVLIAGGLLCNAALVRAADVPALKTSPGKPASLKDPQPGRESTPGVLSRPRAIDDSADGMERLRERLAEKLGSQVQNDEATGVVKVAVRASDATAGRAAPGAPGARKARSAHPGVTGQAWSYEGATGPDHWARLRPDYAQCARGQRQSPIDIRDGIGVVLDPIGFDYKATGFGVIDTGRTVRVNVSAGSSIEVMGRRYVLEHVEFRRPAEERINGRQFDMGAHLVHRDAEGRTAVVAVLMDRGADQPVIQTVWNNLPLEKGEEVPARGTLDFSALLPSDRRYFTYMGSMTTPPCQEGVLWMVMKSPVAVSADQLGIFARLYPMNARPVQPLGGRLIKGPQ